MFNKIKKVAKELVVGAVVMLVTTSLLAFPLVSVTVTNQQIPLITNSGTLNSIQIANPSATFTVVKIYDSPNTNLSYTNIAYTNFLVSTISYTNIYTNYFGQLTTNTYTVKTNTENDVAAGAVNYPLIAAVGVPATTTITYKSGYFFTFGLFATNTTLAASNLVLNLDVSKSQ